MALFITAVLLIGAATALWVLPRKSRWYWKLLGRGTAGALFCASALTLLLVLFVGGICGRYEFPPVSSRDGKLVAQVNEEDCGATDSFHTSVKLWKTRHGPSAWLLGKQGNSATVFTVGHDPRLVVLLWKNDGTLLIRYPNDSRVPAEFRCQPQWGSIHIDCLGYAPDYSKPVAAMPPVQRSMW